MQARRIKRETMIAGVGAQFKEKNALMREVSCNRLQHGVVGEQNIQQHNIDAKTKTVKSNDFQ